MSSSTCRHADVREFDGLRSCLACGETRFQEPSTLASSQISSTSVKATEEQQEYLYTDLRCLERGQTIRLVILEPGDFNDPIRCSLVLSGLQHSEYEAVSYTWATESGDRQKSRSIYIDNSLLYVTRNCEAALRRLRQRQIRRLWMDALCINQASIHERNHQVGLMDRIYREAICVHICIQDPVQDHSRCMRWLTSGAGIQNIAKGLREGISKLFALRYFRRVWVIQEVALARKLILHLNNDSVELQNDILIHLPPKIKIGLPPPIIALLRRSTTSRIAQVLDITGSSACSDPRDRVYGALSLLPVQLRALIPVDYSLHLNQVLANTLFACIRSTCTLDILHFVRLSSEEVDLKSALSFTTEHLDRYLEWANVEERQSFQLPFLSEHQTAPPVPFAPPHEQLHIPLITGQILPCFKIRALLIDVTIALNKSQLRFPPEHHFWSPQYGRYVIPRRHRIDRFQQEVDRLSCDFATQYGDGSSPASSLPGDYLYRIEGSSSLFLLRHLEHTRFRIVSACHWRQIYSPDKTRWVDLEMDAVLNAVERTKTLEVY